MSRLFFAIPGRKCNWETNWSKGIKQFSNFPRKTRELLLRITLFPRGCCYCIYHRSAVSVSDIVLPWIGDAPSKESKSQWFSPNCLLSLLPPIELYTLHHSEFDTRSRKVPTLEHPSRPTLLPAIIAYYCLLLHSYYCLLLPVTSQLLLPIISCYFTAIIALLFVGCAVIIALLVGCTTNSDIYVRNEDEDGGNALCLSCNTHYKN